MPIETEVKIKVEKEKFELIYDELGQGLFFSQRNIIYPLENGFLRLRLEQEPDQEDRIKLTFKGRNQKSQFNARPELELNVGGSFETARQILSASGLIESFDYTKRRVNYPLESAVVSLDILSGDLRYVEIEGAEQDIRKNLARFGLENYPIERRSYQDILIAGRD